MPVLDHTTGPGLVEAVAKTLNREDLYDFIPMWVRNAEASISRELRIHDMLKRSKSVTSAQYVPLPTGWLGLKNIQIGSTKLLYAAPEDLDDIRAACPNGGQPTHYTILGKSIEFAPVPNQELTVEMAYYEKPAPLDLKTVGATNWLLEKAPDLYLYSTLMHSAPFLQEDERLQTWTAMAANILNTLNTESEKAEHSGSRIIVKGRTFG